MIKMTVEERFWSKVKKTESCWLWAGETRKGDFAVYSITAHDKISPSIFAYKLKFGKPPESKSKMKCGNRMCVNPNHLILKASDWEKRFWKYVDKTTHCWNWIGTISPNGYGRMTISRPERGVPTHRISWEIHNGKIPKGILVCHKCDNRKCVRPDHLFLGTCDDNIKDCVRKGRNCRGEKHRSAILKESEVLRMRKIYESNGHSIIQLEKEFPQIGRHGICDVVHRRSWIHI